MRPFCVAYIAVLMAFPITAHAQLSVDGSMQQHMMQQLQEMPPEEREAMVVSMMQNAQALQTCIEEAGGEEALKDLQITAEAHSRQVKSLCESNKRKQAQAYAQDAAEEMKKDPRIEKLRNCSRLALQNMPQLAQIVETGGLDASKHVCD